MLKKVINVQKLYYKLKYYKRLILNFFGLCSICYNQLNYTSKGRGICPNCGR